MAKQKRVSFSESGQQSSQESSSSRRAGILPQETDISKRDRKTQNWFWRQFPGQMADKYDAADDELATAIAAAAYAIYLSEDASTDYQRRQDLETHMTRVKTTKESFKEADLSTRKPVVQDTKASTGAQIQRVSSTRNQETKADAWERDELARIQRRYEKMNSRILAWENEKKTRAKREMERKKSQLELRKTTNTQHYQNKLARIDQIADGARAQIEEKKRYESSQVRERAKKVRSTGRVPLKCWCF